MERGKNPDVAASATGEAQAESGGIANSGVLLVKNLYQYPPETGSPSSEEIADAIGQYAQRVREVFGRLDLEVLTPLTEHEQPVVELREVFVPPFVRADPPAVELPRELVKRLLEHGEIAEIGDLPPGADQGSLDRMRKAFQERQPAPVLEVLAEAGSERIVLLGDPGAGKSTLARYLALALTSPGPRPNAPLGALAGRLPIVVELRRYADKRWRDRTFEDFLEHLHEQEGMSVPRPVLNEMLRQQRVVMIFDGLDELFDPRIRAETAQRVSAFASRHPGIRIVVTSRVIGYQRATLDGAGFRHFMLQDLTEQQIAEFARLWYTNACPNEVPLAQSLVERVTSAVAHSRPIRELAGNPLLLTILAIIGRRQTLPRDRQGVYKHAVTVLVAHWDRDAKQLTSEDAPEALDVLGAEERFELLLLLARRMQAGHGGIAGNHIHGKDLESVFGEYLSQYELPPVQAKAAARAMVAQLRERNFILSRYGGEVYGFVHRAFLEYLAAADIAHRYKEDREWEPEELITKVVEEHAGDTAWHEVILLVVGQLHEREAARAIDRLLYLHQRDVSDTDMLVLAVRALAEVKKIKAVADQSKAVVDSLREAVSRSLFPGHIRLEGALPALATFKDYWTGRQRYMRWFTLSGQYMEEPFDAATLASPLWISVSEAKVFARFSPSPHVRRSALLAFVGLTENITRSVAFLTDRATTDPHETPRSAALRLLGEHFRDDPHTLTLLTDRATTDPHQTPRYMALQLLAEHFRDDPHTLTLLTDHATTDPDESPRYVALRLLGE
ncbi:NACHT domain-containing protein, partial [Streptomyces nitrosporeus]|uniref:NACHT domain-containing protein n=1 Tax=Streptomyces nitrosporeus TaxID=28894 RepID=UPI0036210A4A